MIFFVKNKTKKNLPSSCRKQFVTGYMLPALPLSCERAGKSLGWITKLVNTACDRLS